MRIPVFHIDAFTDRLFSGNPASICLLEKPLAESRLTQLAQENNVPATAFLVPRKQGSYDIRWFAPDYEIDLCGHGTLAAAFVIFNFLEPTLNAIDFHHYKIGKLQVFRQEQLIRLDFPLKELQAYDNDDGLLQKGLGKNPHQVYQFGKERLLAIFGSENEIRDLRPNIELLKNLEHRGVIVTAPGGETDFVSRVFYPKKQICEDAVTGSSFCLLAPYWQSKLNKNKFRCLQMSKRGGYVECEIREDKVALFGQAVLFKRGEILLDE